MLRLSRVSFFPMSTQLASDRWPDRALEKVAKLPSRALRLLTIVLVAVTAVIAFLAAKTPVRTNTFHHDVLGLIAAGWRVFRGQMPVRDFLTPEGALEDFRMGLAIWLGHGQVAASGRVDAILAILVAAGAWLVLRSRMNRLTCVLACITLSLLVACQTPLGSGVEGVKEFTIAMEYNRLGYALLGLMILELLQPAAEGSASERNGSIFSGALLGILLFSKVTFFLVGAAYVVFLFVPGTMNRRRLLWLAGAAAVSLSILWIAIRPGTGLFLANQGLTGSFVMTTRFNPVRMAGKLLLFQPDLWALALAGYFSAVVARSPAWKGALIGIGTFAGGFFLQVTNAQEYGFPLTTLVLLVFMSQCLHAVPNGAAEWEFRGLAAATALWCIAFWAGPVIQDALGVVLATQNSSEATTFETGIDRLAGPDGHSIVFEDDHPLSAFYAEPIAMVAKRDPRLCVMSLAYANPFPFLLDRYTWKTIDDVPQDQLIGDPDLILCPKEGSFEYYNDGFFIARFSALLATQYQVIDETPNWKLYEKTALMAK